MEKERRQNNEGECYQRQAKSHDDGWQEDAPETRIAQILGFGRAIRLASFCSRLFNGYSLARGIILHELSLLRNMPCAHLDAGIMLKYITVKGLAGVRRKTTNGATGQRQRCLLL